MKKEFFLVWPSGRSFWWCYENNAGQYVEADIVVGEPDNPTRHYVQDPEFTYAAQREQCERAYAPGNPHYIFFSNRCKLRKHFRSKGIQLR